MVKQMISATVTIVIDGDTFQTRGGRWYRLAAVCAPEKGKLGWERARNLLADLILNKTVTIDPVGSSYGRTVADVWVGSTHVNAYMRNQGYTCN